jgi:hypothetical protein
MRQPCPDPAQAEQLGFRGDAAETYAREIIYSDLEEPGEDDMFRTVTADFERHGKTVTREQLATKLSACLRARILIA